MYEENCLYSAITRSKQTSNLARTQLDVKLVFLKMPQYSLNSHGTVGLLVHVFHNGVT